MTIRQLALAARSGVAWLLLLAAPLAGAGLGLPEPGRTPENVVPFDVVQAVAQNRVGSLWPKTAMGLVIPCQDYDGATVAYMFHFRIDGKPFPADYEQVVQEDREDINGFQNAPHVAPPSGKFRYAHVLVSARADRTPVITWGEGLSEYFRTGRKAQSQAAEVLADARPVLRRMYFTWPLTYYVFEAAGRAIVMHADLVTQVRSEADFVAACRTDETAREAEVRARLAQNGRTEADLLAEVRQRCDREWSRAQEPWQDLAGVYVPSYEKAPFYDWSFGCSPTSGAMLLGWLDDVCHHGRLIDYHLQRWDTVQREMDYNVPNAQRELAWSMNTDTMTGSTGGANILPGLADVVVRANLYDATWYRWYYYETANWCWDEVVATINAGCPLEWSVHPTGNTGHSLACFGYDPASASFFVHNTWAPPGEFWHYTNGGAYDWTQADYVAPSSPINTYVKLFYPHGDTHYNCNGHRPTFHAWERTSVNSSSTAGDSWKLYLSRQGGLTGTWSLLDKGTGHPGTIYLDVTDAMATEAGRLMLEIYTGGQNLPFAACDGSWGNFRIVAEAPPAPVLTWPYNNGYVRSRFSGVCPGLWVNRISYAQQYWFECYNDSLADTVESGWQADTVWHVSEACPPNSHGWWRAKARNPTGEGAWSGKNSYTIVLDTSNWMPKRKPQMLSKKKPKKGGCVMHKKKKKMQADLAVTDDTLYLLVGNNTREFQRYSVWNDEWSQACSLPAGPKNKRVKGGATLLSDTAFCYAFKGGGTNEFYRYDPSADAWTELAGPSFAKGLKSGYSALVEVAGRDYIYLGSGATLNEWKRYDVAAGAWEALAAVPATKTKAGSSICWDGDQLIYLLAGGNKENFFYSLRPDLGTWTQLASLPLAGPSTRKKKVKEGAGLEFFQGKAYAVKGGNTREFWDFDPGTNQWQYICEVGQGSGTVPVKGISCAKPLAATDDGIYCILGNNTDEFFFYPGDTTHGALARRPGDGTSSSQGTGTRTCGLFISPNPCSRAATIAYSVPGPGRVSLKLYDIAGKLVSTLANGYHPAGSYYSQLTATSSQQKLAAGVYVLRLDSDRHSVTEKLVIE